MAVGGTGPAVAVGKDKPVNPVIALPPSAGGEVGADEGVAAPGEATEEDEPDEDGSTAPPPAAAVEPEPPTVVDTGPEPAAPAEPQPPAPTPEPPVAAPAPPPPAPEPADPAPPAAPEPVPASPSAPPPAAPVPVASAPQPQEPAGPTAPAARAPAPPNSADARAGAAPVSEPPVPTSRRAALEIPRADDPNPVSTDGAAPRRSGARLAVRGGDSLWLIAARLAGPGASDARVARLTSALWDLNAGRIGTHDPNLLPVGVTLDLPTI